MSRPRTTIRRMWDWAGSGTIDSKRGPEFKHDQPVLVIPDNPAARAAMVDRVLKAYSAFPGSFLASRAIVEHVLEIALTP